MQIKNSELLPTGTLYLQDEDGNMTPFMGLAEAALHGCTGGTIKFVDDIPVVQEMTFEIPFEMPHKRLTRAKSQALKKRRSRRALERPMRRIKRQKEKARRYTIKNGIDKKIIAHVKKYLEEHKDEEFSH